VGLATTLLVSGAVAAAGVGLGAGTANAAPFYWCPGDPPIQVLLPNTIHKMVTIYPDWDTTVCHDYMTTADPPQVLEGKPCMLPQFQWFQCPPGTTPRALMTPTPNK
jgi:hypothetical protein